MKQMKYCSANFYLRADVGECCASHSGRLTYTGGWMGLRAGLDVVWNRKMSCS
jgi:hypothetical protein